MSAVWTGFCNPQKLEHSEQTAEQQIHKLSKGVKEEMAPALKEIWLVWMPSAQMLTVR